MQLKPDQWKQLQTMHQDRMEHEGMGEHGRGQWGHDGRGPGMDGPGMNGHGPDGQGDRPMGTVANSIGRTRVRPAGWSFAGSSAPAPRRHLSVAGTLERAPQQ